MCSFFNTVTRIQIVIKIKLGDIMLPGNHRHFLVMTPAAVLNEYVCPSLLLFSSNCAEVPEKFRFLDEEHENQCRDSGD